MQFPEDTTHEAINRLRRAEGQVRGVQRLLEEGADCKAVITQLSAAQAALHRAGVRLMAAGIRHCLEQPDDEGSMNIDEMEKLFLTLR